MTEHDDTTLRSHTTDSSTPFEDLLRRHLDRHAAGVREPHDAPDAESLRRAAALRSGVRHRRRVAAASITSVAAVSLAIGLVVNAQAPQQVDVIDDAAASPPSAGGVATGSSTGSATGAAKGWSSSPIEVGPSSGFTPVALNLDGVDDDTIASAYAFRNERGDGRAAPEIAVLADLDTDGPVRFVVASPQSPRHLTTGSGGVEVTIDGRPARVIVGNHGWFEVIWSMDADTNVLVQSFGVDFDQLASVLATLRVDEAAARMDPGATGLSVVESSAPDRQDGLQLQWMPQSDPSAGGISTSLDQVTGGAYEFWASVADTQYSRAPGLRWVDVAMADGTAARGILSSARSGSADWARLQVMDASGMVYSLVHHVWLADGATPTDATPSAADAVVGAAPNLFRMLDDDAWADLLRAAASNQQEQSQMEIDAAGRRRAEADPSGAAPDGARFEVSTTAPPITTTTVVPPAVPR